MSRTDEYKGEGRYAFLLADAAFKVVVCTPENEKLVIEILELLLPGKHISGITFVNKEFHGLVIEEKSSTFDLLCTDKDTGEEFLVELQNEEKDSFADRMVYYTTFLIREQMALKIKRVREAVEAQMKRGDKPRRVDSMDYRLTPVYLLSLVDFALDHERDDALEDDYISRYGVQNRRNGETLTECLNLVFLEMGRLKLGPDEKDKCRNLLERFIFSMKYMHLLKERPAGFDDPLLVDLYKASELATMTVNRRQNYDKIMTTELDRMCEISFAFKKGKAEGEAIGEARGEARGEACGRAKEKAEMAKALKELGDSDDKIALVSGLSPEEIAAL